MWQRWYVRIRVYLFEQNSEQHKRWIPAFAGMTGVGGAPAWPHGEEHRAAMHLERKRRLEAIEFSVFEATEDVAFCG
jgi:hypothetical protein